METAAHNLTIRITDDAPPLPVAQLKAMLSQPAAENEPDETWPMRGHGLQIVRQAVDSLSFSRTGDRNCVTLQKRLSTGIV